ncbi:hypothetical protein PCANC_04793 [Puccinia coronata f. sp. avenae]|uniref:Uncharacterized protein n=1 Tax=Puccinia coronata f. sp. avenae TaxID=200324 RepID=A0A2N5S3P9_9BASI|nr:hypothetical protein PCANC_23438 [Puccinia coronata f. sp. avenae]PLW54393.1 hypothetical protein PCANC_04793 [Puccinia coronata f. sp. avenae]
MVGSGFKIEWRKLTTKTAQTLTPKSRLNSQVPPSEVAASRQGALRARPGPPVAWRDLCQQRLPFALLWPWTILQLQIACTRAIVPAPLDQCPVVASKRYSVAST